MTDHNSIFLENNQRKDIFIPETFKFQWHITDRCNLKCRHCYQADSDGVAPDYKALETIFDQIRQLAVFWNKRKSEKNKYTISVTGGEPVLNDHFFRVLELISDNKKLFNFSILSNGTRFTKNIVKKLKKFGPSYCQISIEGSRETHDDIRGKGSYEKAVEGAKRLVSEKIPVSFSFTAHRQNYMEFADVVRLGKKLKVSMVWADRMIPHGRGAGLLDDMLDTSETEAFFRLMYRERHKARRSFFCKTDVSMHRALQFLEGGGEPYTCSAGTRIVAIMPDGTVYPCRRMPTPAGNLLEQDLETLFYNSNVLTTLRNPTKISFGCEECFYSKLCRGGLRCLSYAVTGNPFIKDPGCYAGSGYDTVA